MDYQIDVFRQTNDQQEHKRQYVDVIIANKYPEHFENLVESFCAMDSGCNLTIYRIEGDRPDFSFSKAMNAGLWVGTSPYVLFLNDDIQTCQPLWLNSLVEKLESFNLPLINPIQVDFRVSDDQVYRNRLMVNLEENPIRYATVANKYGPAFVEGFCLLGRREDFLKVGGWDEDYSYHFEDIDISLRMEHLRGGKNGIDLTTWVRHGQSISTKRTKEDPEAWAVLKKKIDDSKACFIGKWGQEITIKLGISPPTGVFDFHVLTPMHPRIAGIADLDCFKG